LQVGKDGVITVEEGRGNETTVEVVEGMQFDRGFLSPHFVTDQENVVVELENCCVLIYEDKISSNKPLIPILEAVSKAKKPLLIIAEDVEAEALATLVVNKMRGILQVCAVKAPGYGDRRKAILGDLAALTGAEPIFKDRGIDLENVQLKDLGTVKSVRITSEETVIVDGGGDKKDVEARIEQIRNELNITDSDYDREKLEERLAKLAGGVARISVGAITETEMKERKDLLDDAKSATSAALSGGIVPGGSVSLLRAEKALEGLEVSGDEEMGVRIIKSALEYPLRAIAENAGVDGAVVVNRVRNLENDSDGYNADSGEYGDLVADGVIDPALVVTTALQNACSVSSLLLTTESLITDIPSKEEEGGHDHDHGMGGMDPMGGMGGMGGMGMPGMGGMGGMGGMPGMM